MTQAQHDGLVALAAVLGAIVAGIIVHRIVFAGLAQLAKRREKLFGAIVRRLRRPSAYIIPLLFVLAAFPNLQLPHTWVSIVEHTSGVLTIAATAWGIIAVIELLADFAKGRKARDAEDNLAFRQIETRVGVIVIGIVAVALALMTFPEVRAIGTTLLASAGVAGIAAGLATRPLLENLVAGVQIALTQPIRIDDVVIVQGNFGRVEEITSTYVVVAVWDRRRMIVPLTYFIDTPFENWTRRSADLMGTIFLYTDYGLPVDEVRRYLDEILPQTPLWDGKVKGVQVTDTNATGMETRILVSARNSGQLFDLRCYVREKMLGYISEHYPEKFTSTRIDAPQIALAPR